MATRDELNELTVDELRDRASEADVSGRSKMDKDELVAALADDGGDTGSPPETRTTGDFDPNSDSMVERITARSTREPVSADRSGREPDRLASGTGVPTLDETMKEEREAARESDVTPVQARRATAEEDAGEDGAVLASGRPAPKLDPDLEARRDDLRAKIDEGGTDLTSLSMADLREGR